MRSLLREPLVHFFLLGLGLFVAHHIWDSRIQRSDYAIYVSAAELERQAAIFATENRRQPSDEDLKALLFAHVEEQVLMREAERLGLAEDDTIIRRRLAQKMRFMIEDTAPPPLPSEAELKQWFENNRSRFFTPERVSFSHIFLSPQTRGEEVEQDATEILAQISDENWKSLGDPFMLQKTYTLKSQNELQREFGLSFPKSLFELKPNLWQGPIASAFGLHLVRLNDFQAQIEPDFESVRTEVEKAWQDQAQRARNKSALAKLMKKYKVVVEDPG